MRTKTAQGTVIGLTGNLVDHDEDLEEVTGSGYEQRWGDGSKKSYGFSVILDSPTWDEIHQFTKRASKDHSVMPSPSATSTAETKCRIAELVQYSCEIDEDVSGNSRFHCWPVPRVFRM